MPPAKTGILQGGRFAPGRSGNPKGRPEGSRNKATIAAERLLEGEAEALTRKCIELGKKGDTTALRLCMERIVPPRKLRRVSFKAPETMDTEGLTEGMANLVQAVATGEIAPDEAQAIAAIFETHRRTIETQELEERIRQLEAAQ